MLLSVLTGCVKVELVATVTADDTVEGSLTAAVKREAVEVIGAEPADEFVAALTEDVPGTYEERDYDDGEFLGRTVYYRDVSLGRFSRSDPDDTDSATLRISHDGDRYRLDGEWRLPDLDGTDFVPTMDDSTLEGAEFTVSVTFPGKVLEHNGSLSGRTVTWRLEPGRTNVMTAESAEAAPVDVALIVLLAGIGVVLVVAVLLYLRLRRYSIGNRPRPRPGRVTVAGR
ncbi:hypothetical protein LX16_0080 [Stackebrandtia albiflava]|uniref:LppM domain-containing protein n=1 Tax=Stackebrandtia albiflava TaxID=406432 RepID=A0A562VH70_9ACTN|nr:hypothetical protein LX16_0080 [Stackebrandtia albiflava]